jgi:hypothetical protein
MKTNNHSHTRHHQSISLPSKENLKMVGCDDNDDYDENKILDDENVQNKPLLRRSSNSMLLLYPSTSCLSSTTQETHDQYRSNLPQPPPPPTTTSLVSSSSSASPSNQQQLFLNPHLNVINYKCGSCSTCTAALAPSTKSKSFVNLSNSPSVSFKSNEDCEDNYDEIVENEGEEDDNNCYDNNNKEGEGIKDEGKSVVDYQKEESSKGVDGENHNLYNINMEHVEGNDINNMERGTSNTTLESSKHNNSKTYPHFSMDGLRYTLPLMMEKSCKVRNSDMFEHQSSEVKKLNFFKENRLSRTSSHALSMPSIKKPVLFPNSDSSTSTLMFKNDCDSVNSRSTSTLDYVPSFEEFNKDSSFTTLCTYAPVGSDRRISMESYSSHVVDNDYSHSSISNSSTSQLVGINKAHQQNNSHIDKIKLKHNFHLPPPPPPIQTNFSSPSSNWNELGQAGDFPVHHSPPFRASSHELPWILPNSIFTSNSQKKLF